MWSHVLLDISWLTADRVLHVGAHDAEEQSLYSQLGCEVLWVEAIPSKADNLGRLGFNVVEAVVWSEETDVTFYRTNNDQSSSVLPLEKHLEYYPHIQVSDSWSVRTQTIDAICASNAFVPDAIVLDIQGAELHALMGAEKVLENVNWVYSEISTEPLYVGGVLEDELNIFLEARGFTQVKREMTGFGWGDAIWTRSQI